MYGQSTGALFLAELKLITPGGPKKVTLFLRHGFMMWSNLMAVHSTQDKQILSELSQKTN